MEDNRLRLPWLTVAITRPEVARSQKALRSEAGAITRMLRQGVVDSVHIRKPEATAEQIAALLDLIPERLHPCLCLHDHFELVERYPLLDGVHLNGRNPVFDDEAYTLSASCHTVEEARERQDLDYVTLSPVFDSLSKKGYRGRFAGADLRSDLKDTCQVVGMGGVLPGDFCELQRQGFRGAAMLGYVWQRPQYRTFGAIRKANRIRETFALQFITDGATVEETERQVKGAVRGGCRWVQIRMKDAPEGEVMRALGKVAPLCREKGVTLLVDDHVPLAADWCDGVHVGKNDMPAPQARERLTLGSIIGSTANSPEDVERVWQAGGSDYIGLGPLRFTTTKKNLAEPLGLEGIRSIMEGMRHRRMSLPVVAIGGITPEDVRPLLEAGVHGVAVCGAIAHAPDPEAATKAFITEIEKYYNLNDK